MPRPVLVLLCVLLVCGAAHDGTEDDHKHRLHDHALEESGSPSTTTEEAEEEYREETTTLPPDGIIDIEPLIEQMAEDGFRRGLPIFSRFNGDENVTVNCSAALIKFMFALRKLTPWAMRSKCQTVQPKNKLMFPPRNTPSSPSPSPVGRKVISRSETVTLVTPYLFHSVSSKEFTCLCDDSRLVIFNSSR